MTQSQLSVENKFPRLSPTYYLTLFLLSGTGIFLEITLTRLFSTLFYPPYVFAIISVAILGIGLGAALGTSQSGWRNPSRLPLYLLLAGSATLAVLLVTVWTASINMYGTLLAMVLLPYLFVGLALVTIFGAGPAAGPALYRADLLGAGLGVMLAIPVSLFKSTVTFGPAIQDQFKSVEWLM